MGRDCRQRNLLRDIEFGKSVTSCVYDEAAQRWTVRTAQGDVISAR